MGIGPFDPDSPASATPPPSRAPLAPPASAPVKRALRASFSFLCSPVQPPLRLCTTLSPDGNNSDDDVDEANLLEQIEQARSKRAEAAAAAAAKAAPSSAAAVAAAVGLSTRAVTGVSRGGSKSASRPATPMGFPSALQTSEMRAATAQIAAAVGRIGSERLHAARGGGHHYHAYGASGHGGGAGGHTFLNYECHDAAWLEQLHRKSASPTPSKISPAPTPLPSQLPSYAASYRPSKLPSRAQTPVPHARRGGGGGGGGGGGTEASGTAGAAAMPWGEAALSPWGLSPWGGLDELPQRPATVACSALRGTHSSPSLLPASKQGAAQMKARPTKPSAAVQKLPPAQAKPQAAWPQAAWPLVHKQAAVSAVVAASTARDVEAAEKAKQQQQQQQQQQPAVKPTIKPPQPKQQALSNPSDRPSLKPPPPAPLPPPPPRGTRLEQSSYSGRSGSGVLCGLRTSPSAPQVHRPAVRSAAGALGEPIAHASAQGADFFNLVQGKRLGEGAVPTPRTRPTTPLDSVTAAAGPLPARGALAAYYTGSGLLPIRVALVERR